MEFMRNDGRIYGPKHEDTIKRLIQSNRFKKLDNITVEDLRKYARNKGITGYSSMTKAELISALS